MMAVFKADSKTKDGKQWVFKVYYKTLDGTLKPYKSKKYLLKKEAEEAEIKFKLEKSKIEKNKIKIKDLYQLMINDKETYNKESTIYSYNNQYLKFIEPIIGCRYINELKTKEIEEYKIFLDNLTYTVNEKKYKYTICYKNKLLSILFQIYDYAIKKNYIEINYARNVGIYKSANDKVTIDGEKIKYQTEEEYNLFIANVDDIIYKCFFTTTFWTGARIGELQALTWEDIDFVKWKIRYNKTLSTKTRNGGYKITNTKNRKNRNIPIFNENKQSLIDLYNYYSKFDGFNKKWFVFGGVRYLPYTSIERHLKNYYKQLKIDNPNVIELSHHQFGRHSHVSYLKYMGASTEQIAMRIGDTSQVVENTYLHLYEDEQDKILDIFKKRGEN